jgi:hypothetical protein
MQLNLYNLRHTLLREALLSGQSYYLSYESILKNSGNNTSRVIMLCKGNPQAYLLLEQGSQRLARVWGYFILKIQSSPIKWKIMGVNALTSPIRLWA